MVRDVNERQNMESLSEKFSSLSVTAADSKPSSSEEPAASLVPSSSAVHAASTGLLFDFE